VRLVFGDHLNRASEELSGSPSLPEILWNFSRYKGRARITLEQNPHFYLRCPADESAYTPMFRRHPLHDPNGSLEHNDTVYVLFDRPCRVFLDTEYKSRIFGNIWLLNGTLIFRGLLYVSLSHSFLSDRFPDNSGVLEGEQLVKKSSIQGILWYCEQPVKYHGSLSRSKHHCLRPITTAPLSDSTTRVTLEDWTVLDRPASHPINIHIYCSRRSPGSTTSSVCFHSYIYSDCTHKLLHRIYLHRLQHRSDQDTAFYTRLSIRSRMIYSLAYLTAVDWMTRFLGMANWDGALFLVFVEGGVTSCTPRHSTSVCILYARMALL
jgi:hypothetical protein